MTFDQEVKGCRFLTITYVCIQKSENMLFVQLTFQEIEGKVPKIT